MAESSIARETAEVLEVDPEAFQSRVEEDAATITADIDEGVFDNPQGILGLEYEFYAVDATSGTLKRVPRRLLSLIGFEKELGLHNAEMNVSPQPLNAHGLDTVLSEVRGRLSAALDRTDAEDMRLVSDALWTIPPEGETAQHYLTDSVEDDGIRIATNMSDAARYHAMANTSTPAGMRIEAPHVSLQADTVMPESLITSIQPHFQVPHARDLPTYFRYAIRVAGPLLALGVNSPFFPPDLYDPDADPQTVLEDAWMEHRISVFETSLNAMSLRKVRFPRDIATAEEAVDRVVEDAVFVPIPVDSGDRYDDAFAHFRMKHGTYWRWVRPVFEGPTRAEAHARIEFRPIPGQPTVLDSIAFAAAFAGLLERMHSHGHPVRDLPWPTARNNFYAAVRAGLDADLEWITADGTETARTDAVLRDVLETAAAGLEMRGLDADSVDRYLDPLRDRVRAGVTPARWKHDKVRRRVADGDGLEAAITGMQRDYLDRQAATLVDGAFTDWW